MRSVDVCTGGGAGQAPRTMAAATCRGHGQPVAGQGDGDDAVIVTMASGVGDVPDRLAEGRAYRAGSERLEAEVAA